MLTRLYVDNYKCLVNFDLRLGRQHLLMGRNGTGKTTVFEVLTALKQIADGESVDVWLPPSSTTRWQTRNAQQVELEATLDGRTIKYVLRLQMTSEAVSKSVVAAEELTVDGVAQFSRNNDEVLLGGDGAKTIIIEPQKAALATLPARFASAPVSSFRHWLSSLFVARIDPRQMVRESGKEASSLESDLSNFASWFRHIAQEKLEVVSALNRGLQEVLEGFDSLSLPSGFAGTRRLKSTWRLDENGSRNTVSYWFDELSEGQRALIGLYSLLYFAPAGTTLCLDEPDNFVALREIQPFLLALRDREDIQSLIISHHPEVINLLAPESGLMFARVAGGPARVERFRAPPDAALPPAELIARGWEDGK